MLMTGGWFTIVLTAPMEMECIGMLSSFGIGTWRDETFRASQHLNTPCGASPPDCCEDVMWNAKGGGMREYIEHRRPNWQHSSEAFHVFNI